MPSDYESDIFMIFLQAIHEMSLGCKDYIFIILPSRVCKIHMGECLQTMNVSFGVMHLYYIYYHYL